MTKRRNVSREAEHGNRLITNSLFGAKKDCVSSCGFPDSVKHSSNVPIGNLTQRSGVSLQVIATRPIPAKHLGSIQRMEVGTSTENNPTWQFVMLCAAKNFIQETAEI